MKDSYADFAPFYDLYSAGKTDDIAVYRRIAKAAPGPILELGCGTGRVAIPLARAGFEVWGLESSKAMLEIARTKAHEQPADVASRLNLLQGDMRRFDLGRRFGLVIIPWYGFNYLLTSADRHSCLKPIRKHLLPDGIVALDLFLPLCFTIEPAPEFNKRREARLGNDSRVIFVDRRTYNPTDRIELREHKIITIRADEESEIRFETQRYYCDADEISRLLRGSGLRARSVWGGYDRRDFHEAERNLFVIAELSTDNR